MSARGKWNGLCLAGKHGLDFPTQRCDSCIRANVVEGEVQMLGRRIDDLTSEVSRLKARLKDRERRLKLAEKIVLAGDRGHPLQFVQGPLLDALNLRRALPKPQRKKPATTKESSLVAWGAHLLSKPQRKKAKK